VSLCVTISLKLFPNRSEQERQPRRTPTRIYAVRVYAECWIYISEDRWVKEEKEGEEERECEGEEESEARVTCVYVFV